MLRQWFKGATAIVLSLDGIALRSAGTNKTNGTGEIRIISSNELYSREGLLAALEAQAAELGLQRVRFILSNQLVRYAVLPWQPGIYAMRDWLALASHQFRNQFGVIADGWDIRVALQGHGMPAVACALDRDLIERLSEISAKAGWTVQGIEPALMAVFNRHHNHFTAKSEHGTKSDKWLLLAEPQRVLLGQITNGAWQHFYMDSPLTGEEPMAGQRMVEHALHLQGGVTPAAVACFGPAALLPKSLTDDNSTGITMLRLPHPVRGESKTSPNLLSPDINSLAMLAGVV